MSPFSLEKTYYEVRLWRSITEIHYQWKWRHQPVRSGRNDNRSQQGSEWRGSTYVALQGKQKGTTTLTLTDNVTGDKETVEVKVTDCYIAYGIAESNHPTLTSNLMLYLVNNKARDCYFFTMDNMRHQLNNTIACRRHLWVLCQAEWRGNSSLFASELFSRSIRKLCTKCSNGNPRLRLVVQCDSQAVLEIIKSYAGCGLGGTYQQCHDKKFAPPRDYTMILTVPETDYEIIGAFATASIPEYILNW